MLGTLAFPELTVGFILKHGRMDRPVQCVTVFDPYRQADSRGVMIDRPQCSV